jgi:hypothetical protein
MTVIAWGYGDDQLVGSDIALFAVVVSGYGGDILIISVAVPQYWLQPGAADE